MYMLVEFRNRIEMNKILQCSLFHYIDYNFIKCYLSQVNYY